MQVDELAQQIAARSLSIGSSGALARSVSDIDSELEEVERQRAERELARDAATKRQAKLKDELMAATEALHQVGFVGVLAGHGYACMPRGCCVCCHG